MIAMWVPAEGQVILGSSVMAGQATADLICSLRFRVVLHAIEMLPISLQVSEVYSGLLKHQVA